MKEIIGWGYNVHFLILNESQFKVTLLWGVFNRSYTIQNTEEIEDRVLC